jgi:RsiW-degrading membrane proteinase PrsW (M82 family)
VAIRIYCVNCGQRIKAQDDMGGMRVLCPTCGERMQIPAVEKPPGAEAPKVLLPDLKTAALFTAEDFKSQPKREKYPKDAVAPLPEMVDKGAGPLNRVKPVRVWRGSLYMLFLLAFIPLVISVFFSSNDKPLDRLQRTIDSLPADNRAKADRSLQLAKEGQASLDDVFQYIPDHKVEGAWLPRETESHIALSIVTFVGFMFLLVVCFPKGYSRLVLMLLIALFTGTFGIMLLLLVQLCSSSGLAVVAAGPFGIIIALIGISYRVALDPAMPFFTSFLGFTFGVGLCEEIIKALPIFLMFLGRKRLRWHQCCALGMASGVGFGVAEGLHYASAFYNGLFPQEIYYVRFISCTMLHAVWAGAAALFLHRFQKLTRGNLTFLDGFYRLLILISIPMVLHGLYDTLLKKDIDGIALAVALVSFGWLAIMIETAREKEGDAFVEVTKESDPIEFAALASDRPLSPPTPLPHLMPAADMPQPGPAER